MKIISKLEDKREPLPSGKISIRWVDSQCCYQVYVGGRYLVGCSGQSHEDCQHQIDIRYTR